MSKGRRLLGIEYERLILDRETGASAPLAFCRDFLERLRVRFDAEGIYDGEVLKGLRAARFEMSMEPGGQLEVACPPVERLAEVETIMEEVDAGIAVELEGSGFVLRGLGHAPVTPVAELGLLPRDRYAIMDRRMPARGPLTRNMMRATAGFQLTYDIEDRADAARKLALLYRLSPVFVAISANSRQVAGEDTGFESFRHKVWWETDWMRSGVPEGCLHAETAIDGYIRYAREAEVLFALAPDGSGRVVEAEAASLEDLCARGLVTEADVDLHLTSLFPFVRLRNYIEIRCLDSVEWDLARSMLALISGLVYCQTATANAEAVSESLVVEGPDALRELHLAAARDGLEARVPRPDGSEGVSLREVGRSLVGFSAATLGGKTCDWAEPADLDLVRARVG